MMSVYAPIVGEGRVAASAIQEWFGPQAPADLGRVIVEESARWPEAVVNHDIVAGQVHLETGGWTSAYARERNNPAGLGAVDSSPDDAIRFPTVRAGVRAQIAHLLNYAVGGGPWQTDDPRLSAMKAYRWLGVAPVLDDLTGRWATDPRYAEKIVERVGLLERFARGWEPHMAAQIPGFRWYPAAPTHYTKGRSARIRGGAQHYTAGTDSLAYLTSTSGRSDPNARVSAHFLVRRNATLEFRGWQLVRIEDTAWTTAFANPYTVAIEYEHLAEQDIPQADYEVLGQTWADVTRYVAQHNLGAIETVAGHKVWVNNPSLVCPDGIDVQRVVRRWQELMIDRPPRPPDVGDPDAQYVPATGAWMQWGFRAFWQSNPDALRWLGYPLENERGVGNGLALQRFERGWLLYDAGQPEAWRIHVLPLSRYAEFGVTP